MISGSEAQIIANFGFLLLVYLFFRQYLPKYIKEKAKNLATKEDIGEITEIVEKVKHDNNSQLELIKAELSIFLRAKAAAYDDERNAIIQFVEAVTIFNEQNWSISTQSGPQGIQLQIEQSAVVNQEFLRLSTSSSKLKIFCHSERILQASLEVLRELVIAKGIAIH